MPAALHPTGLGTSRRNLIPGRAVQMKEAEPQEHLVIFTLGTNSMGWISGMYGRSIQCRRSPGSPVRPILLRA